MAHKLAGWAKQNPGQQGDLKALGGRVDMLLKLNDMGHNVEGYLKPMEPYMDKLLGVFTDPSKLSIWQKAAYIAGGAAVVGGGLMAANGIMGGSPMRGVAGGTMMAAGALPFMGGFEGLAGKAPPPPQAPMTAAPAAPAPDPNHVGAMLPALGGFGAAPGQIQDEFHRQQPQRQMQA